MHIWLNIGLNLYLAISLWYFSSGYKVYRADGHESRLDTLNLFFFSLIWPISVTLAVIQNRGVDE